MNSLACNYIGDYDDDYDNDDYHDYHDVHDDHDKDHDGFHIDSNVSVCTYTEMTKMRKWL